MLYREGIAYGAFHYNNYYFFKVDISKDSPNLAAVSAKFTASFVNDDGNLAFLHTNYMLFAGTDTKNKDTVIVAIDNSDMSFSWQKELNIGFSVGSNHVDSLEIKQ